MQDRELSEDKRLSNKERLLISILRMLNIYDYKDQTPGTLSGGQKKRLDI